MRNLQLTAEEVLRWRNDIGPDADAWRAESLAGALAIANAFRAIVAFVGPDGSYGVVAVVLPHVLEHAHQDLEHDNDAGDPAAGGRN